MGKLRIKSQKNRLLAVLFAFAIPGAGHLYAGQHRRGLLLLAIFLLDLTAIVRLADSDGGRHLLLIVYLGMMLPVFYFISVFDSLQSIENAVEPKVFGISDGLLLLTAGTIMLILIRPPEMILPWMNELAELCVGPIIMVASLLLLLRSRRGSLSMIKLGRFTAAALVLTVGALLLWDQIQGRNHIALLGQWWPVIFILLGIEVVMFSVIFKDKEKKVRLDLAGGMIALVITATAFAVTQYADIPFRWLDQFNVDLNGSVDYGEEKGFRYDKAVIKVPLEEGISLIRIVNPNGQVTVRSGDVQEIEVMTAVWVDLSNEAEANVIAEESVVKVTPGTEVELEAKGQSYSTNGSRKPRMNMTVTVPLSMSDKLEMEEVPLPTSTPAEAIEPLEGEGAAVPESEAMTESELSVDPNTQAVAEDHDTIGMEPIDNLNPPEDAESPQKTPVKLTIEADNGSIDVSGLDLPGGLEIGSNMGLITVTNIIGPVSVKGNNGGINASKIVGNSTLETKNGTITAADIEGKLYANTLNGSLELKQVKGDIEAETKNGKIKIDGVGAAVNADTLNGGIEVNSEIVGGNWDVDSTVGEIKLSVPEDGHYTVYGSVTFGNITTDLPLDISKKTIRGTIGEGTYRIQINATNSIVVNRFRGN
ncbi:DUF4097 family beta strand repeat-containing protein [Paenibacillus sp. sgz302251]|uniref:DUF4097 family beta strand repeat-containing protein n=1 Tax=Paenibacillus sp. sgz302251 TaxID=3414493 RepID=UPI003C7C2AE6